MYLVAGLGVTGQSVLRYFHSQGENCLAFDTRADFDISSLQQEFSEVEFALQELPSGWLHRFDTVVLSPGISKAEPWVEALRRSGKQIIGDIELFARAVGVPVIAITGSNGKSTVTTLTGMALQQAGYQVGVGGNIGEPALDLLIDDNEYDVYVLELSSFQLETTYSLQTESSTVLNISEDHMDRYNGIEDYIQAKTKVFADTEFAVIPFGFSEFAMVHHGQLLHFGLKQVNDLTDMDYGIVELDGKLYLGHGKTAQVAIEDMLLQDGHHQLNALAMLALCRPFQVENTHFIEVLKRFNGLPHRTQLIATHNQIAWVNDSKGTNVGATITAIESLGAACSGELVLIAGGVGKDADFSGLKIPVEQFCKTVVLFGRDRDDIYQAIQATDLQNEREVDVLLVEDLNDAVNQAKQIATSGDCVLFSPACASFDQFSSYVQRGEVFESLVKQCCVE